MPSKKILPCPFCGDIPVAKKTVGGFWKLSHHPLDRCPASGEIILNLYPPNSRYANKNELIDYWNRRYNNIKKE